MNSLLLQQLRSDLIEADYSLAALAALWGSQAEGARRRGVFRPAERALEERQPGALRTLGRLFQLGAGVSATELDAALPLLGSSGAAELGLAAPDTAGTFHALLSLNPVTLPAPGGGGQELEFWIISDLDDELRRGPAKPDHVMGVGGATRSLIAQLPSVPNGATFDLGTGCGIVALFLADAGAESVIASDISTRALSIARMNVALNDTGGMAERIEFRLGSLFAPVTGSRFDLIVSNPPFVITPRRSDEAARYEYRDGGMTGDELAATVVRAAPAHLADGGALVCLANWETQWGGHGLERVRGWIDDAAVHADAVLDAWVIERDRVEPSQYAETWARDGGARPGQAGFDALLDTWLDDFASRRIVSIGLGAIHVRRPAAATGASVIHVEQATGALVAESLGSSISDAFTAGTVAARMSDTEVLDTRWLVAAHVSEERIHDPGEESPRAITLVTDRPIARRVTADTLLAASVGVCDGELSLLQIADALATLLEVDADAAAEALVAGARELAWLGMLSPVARAAA